MSSLEKILSENPKTADLAWVPTWSVILAPFPQAKQKDQSLWAPSAGNMGALEVLRIPFYESGSDLNSGCPFCATGATAIPSGMAARWAFILICQGLRGSELSLVDTSLGDLLERTGGSLSGGKSSWRSSLRAAIIGVLQCVIHWKRRDGRYLESSNVSPLLSFATEVEKETDPLRIQIRDVNHVFKRHVDNGVPVDLRRLRWLGRDVLAWDLLVFLAWRVRGVESNGQLIRWEWLMAQLGSQQRAPRAFRQRMRAALLKVKTLYPDLNAEVTAAGLLLKPSPSIFEVA